MFHKCLPVALILSGGFVVSANAQSIPTLTLTEVNNTTLTWAWSGSGATGSGTIKVTLPPLMDAGELWEANIGSPPIGSASDSVAGSWIEPEVATSGIHLLNAVAYNQGGLGGLVVESDTANEFTSNPQLPNGGSQISSGGNFDLVFIDLGDTPSVPDACSSSAMLLFSLTALAAARRFKSASV